MHPALLVIDIQRWFFQLPARQHQLPSLITATNRLIDFFHRHGLPVIHVLTVHKADGGSGDLWMKRNHSICLVEGTTEAEELPEVHRRETDLTVTKTRHSAFIRTKLEDELKRLGVDTVVITGFSTNACVGLTAMDAYEYDFDVMIAQDAICGCGEERSERMLQVLRHEFAFEPVPSAEIMARVAVSGTKGAAS